jgi:acetyl-CoA synthetase
MGDAYLDRWREAAGALDWDRPFDAVLVPDGAGRGAWFTGGRLNAAHNCVDRHLATRGDRPALHWEGEPGDRRTLTYAQLHEEVAALADALAGLGVSRGDGVALHLGLVSEAVIAMLACARLGAVHAVLPAALPADALSDRLQDFSPRVLVTQDGAWRHGVVLPLKARADEALTAVGSVEHTVVVRRAGIDVPWFEGDRWYHELVAAPRGGSRLDRTPPVAMPSDAPLLVTYLANRRGRPHGIVHGTGGLLAYCLEVHRRAFAPDADEVLWTPAELGWVATVTHGVLGPLAAGGTAVVYEGMLDTPAHGRAWEVIARYGVTSLVATTSVMRALQRWADQPPRPEQVASLRRVVTAGEPTDAETDRWLAEVVAGGHTAVANGWGQTELGGVVALQPDAGQLPDAGLEVVDATGEALADGAVGDLVLRHRWPAMALGVHGEPDLRLGHDPARPDLYVTGDLARREGGTIEFLGRSDRVFSVSGQLVSATEVKQVLEEHPYVERAEVVDRPDPRRGRAVVACVALQGGLDGDDELARELRLHVHAMLGGLAQPSAVAFVDAFPEGVGVAALHRALLALTASVEGTLTLTSEQVATAATLDA